MGRAALLPVEPRAHLHRRHGPGRGRRGSPWHVGHLAERNVFCAAHHERHAEPVREPHLGYHHGCCGCGADRQHRRHRAERAQLHGEHLRQPRGQRHAGQPRYQRGGADVWPPGRAGGADPRSRSDCRHHGHWPCSGAASGSGQRHYRLSDVRLRTGRVRAGDARRRAYNVSYERR